MPASEGQRCVSIDWRRDFFLLIGKDIDKGIGNHRQVWMQRELCVSDLNECPASDVLAYPISCIRVNGLEDGLDSNVASRVQSRINRADTGLEPPLVFSCRNRELRPRQGRD